jgi:iron complex outermembrane receptor protein
MLLLKMLCPTLVTVAAVTSLLISAAAHAEDGDVLQEIVVSAQKREQNLQNVGIAMQAFSGAELEDRGITNSIDLAKTLSNVAISGSYGGQMSQFTVRGVTQNDFNDHVESVVALYIDDTYVAMQQGQSFATFDVDRVEVLKGPQGTLFGRNATAGLVQYITKRPTDTFESYLKVDYGSYNDTRLEGAISGPLNDAISARVSGLAERYDGWIKNEYPAETFVPPAEQAGLDSSHLEGAGGNLAGLKYQGALRAQVLAKLGDASKLLLSTFWSQSVASTGPYTSVPSVSIFNSAGQQVNDIFAPSNEVCQSIENGACAHGPFSSTPGVYRPVAGADFFGYLNPSSNGRTTSCDYCFGDADELRTYGATANFSTDLQGATFTAITDYKNFYKNFSLDLEDGPENQFYWHGASREKTLSQEFRLNGSSGKSDWVTGAYYLYIDNHSASGIGALPDSAYPVNNWAQPRVVSELTNSFSLFGQEEYALSDSVSLIAGLRGTIEKKRYGFEVLFVDPTTDCNPFYWCYSPAITFPGFSQPLYSASSSEPLWNWKTELDWHLTQSVMLYGGVTQGMKAGNYNSGGPPLPLSEIPYKPERLLSYETGIKSTFWDDRARLNAAVFYYDYHNYQASRWLGDSSLITNQDATFYGAEVDFNARITPQLELMVNAGYQHNTIYGLQIAGVPTDVEAAFAPNETASASLKYTLPASFFSHGKLSVQVDGNYQSRVWDNPDNFAADRLAGYTLVNGRAIWIDPSGKLQVEASVQNLADKVYRTVGFDLSQVCGCQLEAYGKPRWATVSASYHFQ